LIDNDDNLAKSIHTAIDSAGKNFFGAFGETFGKPNTSFLAQPSNINTIVKKFLVNKDIDLNKELTRKGVDGKKEIPEAAMRYFVKTLETEIKKAKVPQQITPEKKAVAAPLQIAEKRTQAPEKAVLISKPPVKNDEAIVKPTQQSVVPKQSEPAYIETQFKQNNRLSPDLIEGKVYKSNSPDGTEMTYLKKNGLTCVESVDLYGQTTYYELDQYGNIKSLKFPYALSEYQLLIPSDQIIDEQVIPLPYGSRKVTLKLKWAKQACAIYDNNNKIKQLKVSGGWGVKHKEKVIYPIY
jgi:hypothetical protein